MSSQIFDSYVAVYDSLPEKWDESRMFLVEQLKKISNAINVREIGWYLDEELLSGKQFISAANIIPPQQYRSVFRKVIDVSPLVAGANTFPHGINGTLGIDARFTLIDLWVSATNSITLTSQVITDSNVTLDAMNINITSPGAFDRAFCVIEYIKEI